MTDTINTEETILAAARNVFMQKGFAAARMCDIAKTANINQALLHYYFRSKGKLFTVIFEQESRNFHSNILSILHSDQPFFEKLRLMIRKEIEKMTSAPYLPMFILNEMHSNPERLEQYLGNTRHQEIFDTLSSLLEQEQAAGRIRPVSPKQLLLSIHGLTLFPFLALPMIQLTLNVNGAEFDRLLSERIDYASDLIIQSLKV